VDLRRNDVRIAVFALGEDPAYVDSYPHDVVTFRNARDIDPLANELLVVPVTPTAGNSLELAVVAVALVLAVLERIGQAEPLLVPFRGDRSIQPQQLVHGTIPDVVVAVAR
jgi:hypothetical protein